jgi:hypothetical protein
LPSFLFAAFLAERIVGVEVGRRYQYVTFGCLLIGGIVAAIF